MQRSGAPHAGLPPKVCTVIVLGKLGSTGNPISFQPLELDGWPLAHLRGGIDISVLKRTSMTFPPSFPVSLVPSRVSSIRS